MIETLRTKSLSLQNKQPPDREEMEWKGQYRELSMIARVKIHSVLFSWQIKLGEHEFEK